MISIWDRIETYRALAAVTRAVAGALSDPELRAAVLGDAEVWDRMADFEEKLLRRLISENVGPPTYGWAGDANHRRRRRGIDIGR